jgi:Uma2 family endonuclease
MQPPPTISPDQPEALPDHTQLPDRDGSIVNNYQEHPQSSLLSDCLRPRLHELYPDGQFSIGCDSGIYYQYTQAPLAGCKAPDWFLVVGVPPMLDGAIRRSYVLWKEMVKPLIVIEYVSGDGSEERDTTPRTGKFWVYEQAISASYYAIFEVTRASVEVYRLEGGHYRTVAANAAGRYPIEPLGIDLGIWEGKYQDMDIPWLRVWDSATGKLLPLSEERAKAAEDRAETAEGLLDDTRSLLSDETERAEKERKRADKLADKLRELGIDPEA